MSSDEVGIPFCRDSPYLQRALLDQEDYVKALGKYLGDVAKEMKSFNKGLIISINSAVSLAQKMKGAQNIRGDYDLSGKHTGITSSGLVQLEPVLARFSEVLFEIAGAQEILSESLETSFIQPVENFFKVEVPKVADLRKKLNSATDEHEKALGKYLRPPARDGKKSNGSSDGRDNSPPQPPRRRLLGLRRGNTGNSDKERGGGLNGGAGESDGVVFDRRATELATTLREAELSRFNLTFKLNELEARTTFELSECIVTSLYSFRACFHQQLDTVKTLQPVLEELQVTQKNMRDTYQKAKAPWEVRRQRLNEVFYTMGDSPPDEDTPQVDVERDWLADTNKRVAQLYTKEGMDRLEWSNLEERTMSPTNSLNRANSDNGGGVPAPKKKLIKDGYLFMKSTGRLGRAVWHRRWFELDEECLSYVKGPETLDEAPVPVCELMLATVRDIPSYLAEDSAAHSFEVFSANRTSLFLQASGLEDLNAWTSALRNCIEKNLCLNESSSKSPTTSQIENKKGAGMRETESGARAATKVEQREGGLTASNDIVHVLNLEGSGNDTCADCKSKHPEWVSINLGVFLCIQCSGIHRSLGTHISKVRSTTLDSLSSETVALLRCLGNNKANSILEHSVQEGWFKPEEEDERKVKEQWIRSKYAFKGFVCYESDLSQSEAKEKAERQLHMSAVSSNVLQVLGAIAKEVNINCLSTYPLQADHMEKAKLHHCRGTALHAAAAGGCSEVVELLLQNGADCMIRTQKLEPPSSPGVAASSLVDQKVDPSKQGHTPLEVALANGHSEVARALRIWAER